MGTTLRGSVRLIARRGAPVELRRRGESPAPAPPAVPSTEPERADAVDENPDRLARGVVLVAVYLAAGLVCARTAALPGTAVALAFAPSGIALFSVLRWGNWAIPWLFLGELLLAWTIGLRLEVAAALGVGTVLEAVVDGGILRLIRFHHRLDRIRDVLGLVLSGAMVGHVLSATVGVSALWGAGLIPSDEFWSTWRLWWLANMMGRLVVCPLLLTWATDPTPPRGAGRLGEGLVVLAALAIVGELAFGHWTIGGTIHPLLVFTTFPALMWAAVRFGPRGAATGVFVVVVLAVEAAAKGEGPFSQGDIAERLSFLNTFLAGASLTSLLMAAVFAERERIEQALTSSNRSLEHQIAERKRMETRMIQTEKLASLGLLSAGVAHEINNPLAFVANNLSLLERDCRGLLGLIDMIDETRQAVAPGHPDLAARIACAAEEIELDYTRAHMLPMVDRTRQGVQRISEIVRNLRGFARLDQTPVERVDLHQTITSALEMVRCQFIQRRIDLTLDRGALPPVLCAPGQINQVVMNLLINALQAVETAGRSDGRVEIVTRSGDGEAVIEIADNGGGIPDEILPRVFDPFFTTKPIGQGTGLGLSISHGIIGNHGGRIEIESRAGVGTRFLVVLPVDGPPNF